MGQFCGVAAAPGWSWTAWSRAGREQPASWTGYRPCKLTQMSDMVQLHEEVAAARALSGFRLAELTSKFVATPSVNGEHPEAALAEVIAAELAPYGFALHMVGDPIRPSLAAVLGTHPGDAGRGVVLNGHMDTVPVDDAEHWMHPPFGGAVADGAVHGRGACDMKGGLAIMVALGQWLAGRPSLPERLVLQFAMGEERGEPGTESLVEADFVAPFGVVLEPTELQIGIAQRGLVTLRITVHGRAAHASSRHLADNPIRHVPAVLDVLRRLEDAENRQHPLLGRPTWTPTAVHAGVIPSMIPGACEVQVDRRMLPGDTVERLVSDLEDSLLSVLDGVHADVTVVDAEGIYQPAEI